MAYVFELSICSTFVVLVFYVVFWFSAKFSMLTPYPNSHLLNHGFSEHESFKLIINRNFSLVEFALIYGKRKFASHTSLENSYSCKCSALRCGNLTCISWIKSWSMVNHAYIYLLPILGLPDLKLERFRVTCVYFLCVSLLCNILIIALSVILTLCLYFCLAAQQWCRECHKHILDQHFCRFVSVSIKPSYAFNYSYSNGLYM